MSGGNFGGGTAVLVLEDGRIFRGSTFGAVGQTSVRPSSAPA